MSYHTWSQTPREIRRRIIDFSCWLAEDDTIDVANVTVTPPQATPVTGYIQPAFDQRIVEINTDDWEMDGIQTMFPLKTPQGVYVQPLGAQYLTLFDGDVPLRPGVDFFVSGTQVQFAEPPAGDEVFWATLQNPVVQGDPRMTDPLMDPPYSAFDAQAYIVAPDNKQIALVAQGGSAPLVYKVRLVAQSVNGLQREVAAQYRIREP